METKLPYADLDIDGAFGEGLSKELKNKIQKAVFSYTCEDCPENFYLEGLQFPELSAEEFLEPENLQAEDLHVFLFNFGDLATEIIDDQSDAKDFSPEEKNKLIINECICQAFGTLFENNKFVITNNHINYCINHLDDKQKTKYIKYLKMKKQDGEQIILNLVDTDPDGKDPLFILREKLEAISQKETKHLSR